jgi:hypothetical protein
MGPRAKGNLATYLNDHLAGSVVAIELMEHLEKVHAGSELATKLSEIRAEILRDRGELEAIMHRQRIEQSSTRKVMAWLSEKFAEIKLGLDDPAGGSLHLLEALEAVAVGIDGKRALWRALNAAQIDALSDTDLQRLDQRALHQRGEMELLRLKAAEKALRDIDDLRR